jgi:hypothetical protein
MSKAWTAVMLGLLAGGCALPEAGAHPAGSAAAACGVGSPARGGVSA